jgi:hypothetical protein
VDPEIEDSHDPEGEEYVVELLVGLRREADGSESYMVRWFGYSRDEDTLEPSANPPPSVVKRYRRRVGLSQTI